MSSRSSSAGSAFDPLRSGPFRALWLANVLTWAVQFLQLVALGWLIYEITSSPTWLGIVSFARGIPMLVLALPAGVLVDRFDRRRILIVAQVLGTIIPAALALLLWADRLQPWMVAAAAFLIGTTSVVLIPARSTLVPATLPRAQVPAGVALISAGTNGGRVLGPALGGLIMAGVGLAATFASQALAVAVALLLTFAVPSDPRTRPGKGGSPFRSMLEGLRYVWRDQTVFALMLLTSLICLLVLPYTYLLPIFVRDILQAGPGGMGLLMGAAGLGSVLGSVTMAVVAPRRQGLLLLGSTVAFSLLLFGLAESTSLVLSTTLMGLMGFSQAIFLAAINTLILVATPEELQGRVMSAYITTWGFIPLGALPQGVLADFIGAPIVVAGASLLCAGAVIVTGLRYPALRAI